MTKQLVKKIQDLGSDAVTIRDAAHEACHALDTDTPQGHWDRETIHKYMLEKFPNAADQVAAEAFARAVEWHVCQRLGEKYDLKHWAFITYMETLKRGGVRTPINFWEAAIIRTYNSTKSLDGRQAPLIHCRV